MTWDEVKLFIKFLLGSMAVVASVSGLWLTLDLPQVASKGYVNAKFIRVAGSTQALTSSLTSIKLQINKMTRQSLESEKYTLKQRLKDGLDFDAQKRLNDIDANLRDVSAERERLQEEQAHTKPPH